MTKPRS
jgi:hypothetical protein